jgi:hypothetical protein
VLAITKWSILDVMAVTKWSVQAPSSKKAPLGSYALPQAGAVRQNRARKRTSQKPSAAHQGARSAKTQIRPTAPPAAGGIRYAPDPISKRKKKNPQRYISLSALSLSSTVQFTMIGGVR